MEVLTQASMALGEALYKASQEETPSEVQDESEKENKKRKLFF